VNHISDIRSATNAFRNVSSLGDYDMDWRSLFPTKSDLELESIISHTCRLLTTRHQLFTVIVTAQPFSEGMGIVARRRGGGSWLGSEKAVAQVWRDAYPDADGRHRFRVRFFKIVRD